MIKIFNSQVLEIKDLTSDIKTLKLSVPNDFEFRAGQYLSLSVFREDGKKIRKPFSISNLPDSGFIEFCIKIISGGLASEFVKTLVYGNEVELFGPAGKFVINDFNKDLIFIAAGVGIAPFMSMIPDLLKRGFSRKIILLKSARSENDSLYDKELRELMKEHSNFEFHNVFSNPIQNRDKGYVQNFLERYIPDRFNGNFYVCGLKEMIENVKKKLLDFDFRDEQIFYEKFN